MAAGTSVKNPFDSPPVASRYVTGRPYYHRTALAVAFDELRLERVNVAVDVACGTGLSTQALCERAERVIALDTSLAMLRMADPTRNATLLVARAERLPLRTSCSDLATVGAAFHWFDQPSAFAELARVLRPGAALAVYSDFFHGKIVGQPGFTEWLTESYLPRFPTPARHAYFDPQAAEAAGFESPRYAEGELIVALSAGQVADYMLSQSNAAVAIESGSVEASALRTEILAQTSPFFSGDEPADVSFGIRVWTTKLV